MNQSISNLKLEMDLKFETLNAQVQSLADQLRNFQGYQSNQRYRSRSIPFTVSFVANEIYFVTNEIAFVSTENNFVLTEIIIGKSENNFVTNELNFVRNEKIFVIIALFCHN